MNAKLILGLSLSAVLSIPVVSAFAKDAPVVEASLSYQVPTVGNVSVADLSKGDDQLTDDIQKQSSSAASPTNPQGSLDQPQNTPPPASLAIMPIDQRVVRLEQQVNNIANMNLPQQITALQQQIAQLRGQLAVQGHDLQLINKQLRSFYKDFDDRITQMKNLNSPSSPSSINNKISNSTTSVELQDANAYQVAFSQLVNHKLDKSKQSFQNYINQYPNGRYVADAHYWLGEIYLTSNDYKNANSEFKTVLSKYPKSAKVSDAKLKIAIIHANTGKLDQAKNELQSIRNTHPESSAAQLANIRLQQLNEGPDFSGQ